MKFVRACVGDCWVRNVGGKSSLKRKLGAQTDGLVLLKKIVVVLMKTDQSKITVGVFNLMFYLQIGDGLSSQVACRDFCRDGFELSAIPRAR